MTSPKTTNRESGTDLNLSFGRHLAYKGLIDNDMILLRRFSAYDTTIQFREYCRVMGVVLNHVETKSGLALFFGRCDQY